jgi:hypothetical protein
LQSEAKKKGQKKKHPQTNEKKHLKRKIKKDLIELVGHCTELHPSCLRLEPAEAPSACCYRGSVISSAGF